MRPVVKRGPSAEAMSTSPFRCPFACPFAKPFMTGIVCIATAISVAAGSARVNRVGPGA
jgi:hypothetical protein